MLVETAIIGPLDVATMFAVLTSCATVQERRSMALRSTLIAAIILVIFAWAGEFLLGRLGISLAALRVTGGILLLLMGIEMVFARSSGATSTTNEEAQEAAVKQDITVFPLATPLIAGPGAMGPAILLMADVHGQLSYQLAVMVGLAAVLLLTLTGLQLATRLQQLLGVTGMYVIGRVFGILLSALAVQFIFDGIAQSGLLGN